MITLDRMRGFSLIEILVVIVIVGIVSSVALLSLGILGDDRDLQTESRRFISLVQVAQDEATMQGREFGIEVMTNSYRFVEFDPFSNLWGELLGDDTFRQRQLPEGVEFDLLIEGRRVILDSEPADFDESDDERANTLSASYAPHILIFSSGDMTPFELQLVRTDARQVVALRSDAAGAIEVVADDE